MTSNAALKEITDKQRENLPHRRVDDPDNYYTFKPLVNIELDQYLADVMYFSTPVHLTPDGYSMGDEILIPVYTLQHMASRYMFATIVSKGDYKSEDLFPEDVRYIRIPTTTGELSPFALEILRFTYWVITNTKRPMRKLTVDSGGEFINNAFQKMLIHKQITLYLPPPNNPGALNVLNRSHRTMRTIVDRLQAENDEIMYVKNIGTYIETAVKMFNAHVVRTLEYSPNELFNNIDLMLHHQLKLKRQLLKAAIKHPVFNPGDKVRIYRQDGKGAHDKTYWSADVWEVVQADGWYYIVKSLLDGDHKRVAPFNMKHSLYPINIKSKEQPRRTNIHVPFTKILDYDIDANGLLRYQMELPQRQSDGSLSIEEVWVSVKELRPLAAKKTKLEKEFLMSLKGVYRKLLGYAIYGNK